MKTWKYYKMKMDLQVRCLKGGAMEEHSVSLLTTQLWANLKGLYVCVTAEEVLEASMFAQSSLSSAAIILIVAR